VNGRVDEAGRALLTLTIHTPDQSARKLDVWVDTAFDGELVVSRHIIQELGLAQSAAVEATLADGTKVVLETFACVLEWFEARQTVEVVANEGRLPLLGIGLLKDRKLTVDYRLRTLELN